MKIAVYTFISGQYDTLKPFNKDYNKEADFYFFTDCPQAIESGQYEIVIVPIEKGKERYIARHHKMSSHTLFPNYDYTIWLDGSVTLQSNPKELVDKYLNNRDVAAFKYPDEDCIYIYADKCGKTGRMTISSLTPHMEFYRSEGFPEHAGLCEMRILLRKNTEQIKELNELWFETYKKWLTCDQLCFNYVLWKLRIEYNTVPWGSDEFGLGLHQQYNPHRY